MNGEDGTRDEFYYSEGDPSGWLAVSISVSDGSVRAAAIVAKCGSAGVFSPMLEIVAFRPKN